MEGGGGEGWREREREGTRHGHVNSPLALLSMISVACGQWQSENIK